MTVRASKPSLNLREALSELNKPSGVAGEAMLRAETPQEQFNLIGAGRKNLIINGGFDVWQRGTSQTTDGYGSVDRWAGVNTLSGASFSKATRGLQWQGTVGTTPWYNGIAQKIENVWQYLSDQTVVTVSFKLTVNRAESTSTAKSSMWDYSRVKNAGEYTLPSVSGTYSYTVDLYEAVAGDIFDLGFYFGDGDYIIENVQLELGSVATPFEHRSYGEELALCQRYYQDHTNEDVSRAVLPYTTTLAYSDSVIFPVTMRATPTITVSNGQYYNGGWRTPSSSLVYRQNINGFNWEPSANSSHLYTQWQPFLGKFRYTADAEL